MDSEKTITLNSTGIKTIVEALIFSAVTDAELDNKFPSKYAIELATTLAKELDADEQLNTAIFSMGDVDVPEFEDDLAHEALKNIKQLKTSE